jgi:hypothetical protein
MRKDFILCGETLPTIQIDQPQRLGIFGLSVPEKAAAALYKLDGSINPDDWLAVCQEYQTFANAAPAGSIDLEPDGTINGTDKTIQYFLTQFMDAPGLPQVVDEGDVQNIINCMRDAGMASLGTQIANTINNVSAGANAGGQAIANLPQSVAANVLAPLLPYIIGGLALVIVLFYINSQAKRPTTQK